MLIVDPNSTCDVCMENYMDGAHMPYAITCGHIFCRACLDSMQTQCPLCRDRFSRWDIRELRVDSGAPSSSRRRRRSIRKWSTFWTTSQTLRTATLPSKKCRGWSTCVTRTTLPSRILVTCILLSGLVTSSCQPCWKRGQNCFRRRNSFPNTLLQRMTSAIGLPWNSKPFKSNSNIQYT
ncbi:hypothetical protein OG21DRAFT_1111499 [Imleria badia]|nr:hypothetical protein OG21DRAFT_1111499 [Imleria badia]